MRRVLAILTLLLTATSAFATKSYICGFEMGHLGEVFAVTGTGCSVQGTTVRTGSYALKIAPSSNWCGVSFKSRANGGTFRNLFYSVRFYIKMVTPPSSAFSREFFGLYDSTPTLKDFAGLTTSNGTLLLGVASTGSTSGSQLTNDGLWHRIDIEIISASSRKLYLDGVLNITDTHTGGAASAQPESRFGMSFNNHNTDTVEYYIDDIVFDDGDAIIGAGQEILLTPVSDNARTGWTAGAGATTSLFAATNNIPPAGLAAGSETNTSQIKDGASSSTDNYDANVSIYATKKVPSGATIKAVMPICAHGYEVTSDVGDIRVISNPSDGGSDGSRYDFGNSGGVAAGTYNTGWATAVGAVTANPGVALGISPVVRVGKRTANTNVQDVAFIGLYVDYVAGVQPCTLAMLGVGPC